jgi:REP element-mobilizing transposase RayT
MQNELIISSHAVGESNYHIQLTPAYRQDIFVDPLIAELTLGYIVQKMKDLRVCLLAYNYGPDHLHLFFSNLRFVSEVEFVRQIKGYSSYMMRKGHKYMFDKKLWGKKFWSEGHFYRSVGAVNKETMRHYIDECQEKHWIQLSEQQSLIAYS